MPGDGVKFPTLGAKDVFPLYAIKSDGSYEIMKATARNVDVITVVRAQEGTAALTLAPNDRIEVRMTNAAFVDRIIPDSMLGIIAMWGGAVTDIPRGWVLCDGTNGTIDLRGLFVVGAGAAGSKYAVGAKGGVDTVALTTAQMPAHNHGINDPGHAHGVYDPGHNHYVNDPGHAHSSPTQVPLSGGGWPRGFTAGGADIGSYGTVGINGSGTGIWLNPSATGIQIYGSGTGISTQSNGSGQAHENRPPYYALAYIQYKGTL
ncbi:hypothetical protein [Caballeronia zhejiangensis]|nr:hypothetical protein [Caballeronia zhejiangensis]